MERDNFYHVYYNDFYVYYYDVLPVCELFQNYRQHIAVACADSIYVLELTVCYETNMIHSHDYKKD